MDPLFTITSFTPFEMKFSEKSFQDLFTRAALAISDGGRYSQIKQQTSGGMFAIGVMRPGKN